jgi:hypothetical protein
MNCTQYDSIDEEDITSTRTCSSFYEIIKDLSLENTLILVFYFITVFLTVVMVRNNG